MDGWNTSFLLGWLIFRGRLLVLGISQYHWPPETARNLLFFSRVIPFKPSIATVTEKGSMPKYTILGSYGICFQLVNQHILPDGIVET